MVWFDSELNATSAPNAQNQNARTFRRGRSIMFVRRRLPARRNKVQRATARMVAFPKGFGVLEMRCGVRSIGANPARCRIPYPLRETESMTPLHRRGAETGKGKGGCQGLLTNFAKHLNWRPCPP